MHPDSPIRDHQAWLGYLQPDGLVVSPAALVDSQVPLDRNTLPLQERFLPFVQEVERNGGDALPAITDFATFACDFLEWPEDFLFGLNDDLPIPDSLTVAVQEGETLSPSLAFRDPEPKDSAQPWLLLVQILQPDTDLDARVAADDRAWSASPHQRFERLLRGTKVPIGLITNGAELRLIYAPQGETSGSITFPVQAMTEVAGRPILAAFHTLLSRDRLLTGPTQARLPALLVRSREYQSRVSIALAQQVLDALYELQRGFQAANERTKSELLVAVLERNADDVYAALLTVLMRLVFLLFAEDRGLMPTSELYVRHYAIHGLFERLRSDNEHYPDTMDQRFGAWAQLLALFRTVYHGCKHPQLHMPARHGHLFDPNRYAFIEGRTTEARLPLVSDGTIFRILEKLLILDGERLSYRTLDVEEIGSVYQTVMGFRLEVASGPSIAIVGKRKHKGEVAAPTVINLDELRATPGDERVKWLKERTNQETSGEAEKALKCASSVDELLAALDRKIARNATPSVVPNGAMVLQPTDERRRSGSHYTPRSFTEPIVRTTLQPILERLGEHPTPEQILDLKVCDLAVGSGAFLVEACRQLGDALVKAWQHHEDRPPLPPDETEELLARRLVSQRCLYAVDRNPMAADLTKLSLWLATLAKDHPFTFLDHAIRSGDSLVGLTRQQIADFHWLPGQRVLSHVTIESRIRSATVYRKRILDAGDASSPQLKHEQLEAADEALDQVRFVGDLVIAAFFSSDRDRARREKRDELLGRLTNALQKLDVTDAFEEIDSLRKGPHPVVPFHWEIEFPEVFDRENPGFDAIVGNPPFLGGSKLSSVAGKRYMAWLAISFPESRGKSDLVAYFFRHTFNLMRGRGAFGLIATNTIRQGDTRHTGLRWIRRHSGTIYLADLRRRWPGVAAVVVSVAHVFKGTGFDDPILLNGSPVPEITAYLFHFGPDDNPACLATNGERVHSGTNINGKGFVLSPEEQVSFIETDPRNEERIRPYLGGEEMNESPEATHGRYVIYMEGLNEAEAMRWPSLYQHLYSTVRVQRADSHEKRLRERWWLYSRPAIELYEACAGMTRLLASGRAGSHVSFVFQPPKTIFSDSLTLFLFQDYAGFAVLQSRVHEVWARFFGSSLKDDNRYIPEDCFETFPFPQEFDGVASLEQAGREYYEFRAVLMVKNNEGLTKTYNRFHDPDETSPDILSLRELHAAVDRAILEAYGWHDIAEQAHCEFLLDYEDEEDNEDDGRARWRKKPWRYRWPDDIRDEVLARLLALNAERAEEERLEGMMANSSSGSGKRKPIARKGKSAESPRQGELITARPKDLDY